MPIQSLYGASRDIPDHWIVQYLNQPDTFLGKQNQSVARVIMHVSHTQVLALAETRGLTASSPSKVFPSE